MFLTEIDYKSQIRDYNLKKIIDEDPDVLLQAQDSAIAQVKDYLYERYDTEAIFSATGTARHAYLVRCCIYIVKYIISERLPKGVPAEVEKNYNDTLDYLESIRDAKISADLPRKVTDDGKTKTKTRWGSQPARSH
jgi:phage gp36-like protein